MVGGRTTALALALAACGGSGFSERALREQADAFEPADDVGPKGGSWRGFGMPPDVFGTVALYPGIAAPLVSVDRSSGFPVVADFRDNGKFRKRSEVDLGTLAEIAAPPAVWSVVSTGEAIAVERRLAEEADDVTVLDLPAERIEVELTAVTSVAASPGALVLVDRESGAMAVVRTKTSGSLEVTLAAVSAARVCAAAEIGRAVAFTVSADDRQLGCDELWLVSGDSVTRTLGGIGTDVAGVGFVGELVLALTRGTSCESTPCELAAALRAPDGTVLKELGTVPLSARTDVVVGEVAGVPIAFGGVARVPSDGEQGSALRIERETFEVVEPGIAERVLTDGALLGPDGWQGFRPYPIGHRRINEPIAVVLTPANLAVVNRNALGLWSPTAGPTWRLSDLYRWPLYVATENACLNLRARPGLTSYVVDCLDSGTMFWSDGAHVDLDGERWVSVLASDSGLRGWVAERFLSGVSPDEPAEFYCGVP